MYCVCIANGIRKKKVEQLKIGTENHHCDFYGLSDVCACFPSNTSMYYEHTECLTIINEFSALFARNSSLTPVGPGLKLRTCLCIKPQTDNAVPETYKYKEEEWSTSAALQ